GWHYVLIASQDGYGKDYVRAIGNTPGEWTGGGCADPMWAPQIYDYLAPEGRSQEELLAAYDPAMGEYPVLSPVEVR
ncbi:MAG TPA: glycoside hydrolase family 13, partial [Candidatus Acetothermia bacterium]|nr:glycoside hydrolase family 13 [Candidatus Acetothermia bacterium]